MFQPGDALLEIGDLSILGFHRRVDLFRLVIQPRDPAVACLHQPCLAIKTRSLGVKACYHGLLQAVETLFKIRNLTFETLFKIRNQWLNVVTHQSLF
jgi:hypothetical protein